MKLNINFSSAGFGKVFQNPKNLSVTASSKKTITQASKILSNIEIPKGKPVEFKSIPELVGIEYVGYVIEKERFDPITEEWIKTDEYKIIGTSSNVFRDTRIAYGFTYRYRMKSVLKLTIKKPTKDLTDFSQIDLQKFVSEKIKQGVKQNKTSLSLLQQQGNDGLDLKTSLGVTEKNLKLTEGIKHVLSDDNSLIATQITEKTIDLFSGRSMSQEQFAKAIHKSIQEKKKEKKEFDYVSIYYESDPTKDWIVVDVVKLTPPQYPQAIKIFPNSTKKEISISWLKPVSDVEVRFYNVYRREKIGERWEVLVEGLREVETLFVDKNVEFYRKYIYAISSIDAHGIESFLSAQIQAELNPNIAIEKKEKSLVWMSGGGTTIDETSLILKKFFQRKEQLIARKNIVLKPNTKFREESKDFLIKITSLDTHEKYELKVTLKNQKIEGDR